MPSQRQNLTIVAPIGGVNRRVGFQTQPPFTTQASLNFWPNDVITGRAVSATRPPRAAISDTPGEDIVGMCKINGVSTGKPLQSMVAIGGGDVYWWDGTAWNAATGAGATNQETSTALFPTPFLQKAYIPQFGGKPWVFDYDAGTVTELVESAGTVPDDLRIFEVWQGALWGAGVQANPNVLYASRVGNATDWDFAAPVTDTGGAFFTAGEDEGLLRGPITAIMPHTADSMIVSTTEGLVAFRLHPRKGGVVEDIGGSYVLGQGAWTKGPNDELFMMTRLGLMVLPPTPGATPALVSDQKIPNELIGLAYDFADPNINIQYDTRFKGIHITIRGSSTVQDAWWYDMNTGGFHQCSYDGYPHVMMEFDTFINADQSGVLFGGANAAYSGISQLDRTGVESFSSSLTIGPFAIAPTILDKAQILRSKFVFVGNTPTADGTVSIAGGADAEDAINRLDAGKAQYTTGLTSLANNQCVAMPKVAGQSAAMKIEMTSGRVALEEVGIQLAAAGFNRMARVFSESATCQAYVTATPQTTPATAIADGIEIINMNLFATEWWDLALDTGANIRVTDANNNFLPFDLLGYERTDGTSRVDRGAIVLRRPLPTTAAPVRCWVCSSNTASFPIGGPYGQYNSYPPWFTVGWPGGYGRNRTPLSLPVIPITDTTDLIEEENPFHPNNPYPADGRVTPTCDPEDTEPLYGIGMTVSPETFGAPNIIVETGSALMVCLMFGGMEIVDECNGQGEGTASNEAIVHFLNLIELAGYWGVVKKQNGVYTTEVLREDMLTLDSGFNPWSTLFASNSLNFEFLDYYSTSKTGVTTTIADDIPTSKISFTPNGLPATMSESSVRDSLFTTLNSQPGWSGTSDGMWMKKAFVGSPVYFNSIYDSTAYKFFQSMYRSTSGTVAATNEAYWGSGAFGTLVSPGDTTLRG